MTAGVLLALSGPAESELVRLLDASDGAARVVRRCADLPEVLAAAAAGLGAVAVLGSELPVDRAVVARLRAAGTAVLLVATTPEEFTRCVALGAQRVEPAGSASALAGAVTELAQSLTRDAGPARPRSDTVPRGTGGEEPMPEDAGTQLRLTGSASGKSAAPADPRSTSAAEGSGTWEAAPVAGEAGKVIVVWGPPGAPGRTTLAVTLAAELTRLAGRALLVDADTEAPAVTQVLGILDDASAVAAVSRQAMAGRLDPTSLLRSCPLVDGGLHVMTGLTRADRWREVPAAALEVVWEVARSAVPWTVVDTGATLEAEVGALAGPGRHEATASALAAADVLLVVGAGDPVGMRRLVMALHDLSDAGLAGAEPLVVVNRIRSSAGGATPERSIQEALARFAGVGEAVLVPDDRPMFDKALLQGRSLTEVAPASAARLEIELLARRLTGERRRRRRQRRLFRLRA